MVHSDSLVLLAFRRTVVCLLASLASSAWASDVPVSLDATVKSIRAYAGSAATTPLSIFNIGDTVTGSFIFDTAAVDSYASDPTIGYFLSGLKAFNVSVQGSSLSWSAAGGLAQLENDYCSSSPCTSINDRVRVASYPSLYGLTGSSIDGNAVLTVDIDVYEFSAVPPTPMHPLLVSKSYPSPGYLLFDAGALELQWYQGSTLISTYLDFNAVATPVSEPTTTLMLLFGVLGITYASARSRSHRRGEG